MPNIGELIGNYRLTETLASGTFGQVYLAAHTLLKQRQVAVKFLRLERLDSLEERDKFLQEAQLLDKLKHPAILPIVDVGLHNDIPYIMTEYAPHGTLRAYIKRQGSRPISLTEALQIILPIGEALQYAHEHKVVHRDLKPENIFLNAHNTALLADFGIAVALASSSTNLGKAEGTIPYMAPEQFSGTISPRSDQYALGCIAYELLTGRRVFSSSHLGTAVLWTPPVKPTEINPVLPEYIETAILKALAKDRNERYPNVAAFLIALRSPAPALQVSLPVPEQSTEQEPSTQPLTSRPENSINVFAIPPSPPPSPIFQSARSIEDHLPNPASLSVALPQAQSAQARPFSPYQSSAASFFMPSLPPAPELAHPVHQRIWTPGFILIFLLTLLITMGGSFVTLNIAFPYGPLNPAGLDHPTEAVLATVTVIVSLSMALIIRGLLARSISILSTFFCLMATGCFLLQTFQDIQNPNQPFLQVQIIDGFLNSGLLGASIISLGWLILRPRTWIDRCFLFFFFGSSSLCAFLQVPYLDQNISKHLLLLLALISLSLGLLLTWQIARKRQ